MRLTPGTHVKNFFLTFALNQDKIEGLSPICIFTYRGAYPSRSLCLTIGRVLWTVS
jgi:hypothetical protein